MRQAGKAVAQIEVNTLVRVAGVRAEAVVQMEKLREVTHLTQHAMVNEATTCTMAGLLAGTNAMLYDDLQHYRGVHRMAQTQIMLDTVETYCRESR